MTFLILSFFVIALILGWLIIRVRGNLVSKLVVISMCLWYTLAVISAIPSIKGWATDQSVSGSSCVLISHHIDEPTWIYFWVLKLSDKQLSEKIGQLDPRTAFQVEEGSSPRAYKTPYTKQLHKNLMELLTKRGEKGGMILLKGKDRKGSDRKGTESTEIGDQRNQDNIELSYINPSSLLPKEDQ
jgi:hypothetical protein